MKNFICKQCKKEFQSKKASKGRIPKFCSQKCYGFSIAKLKKCLNCGREFYNWQNKYFCSMKCSGEFKRGKKLSDNHIKSLSRAKKGKPIKHFIEKWVEIKDKISKSLTGKSQPWNQNENHHSWKGDEASYTAFHQWVRRKLGRPQNCELCGDRRKRKYEWANLTGDYRNLNDYVRVCTPCHRKIDGFSFKN